MLFRSMSLTCPPGKISSKIRAPVDDQNKLAGHECIPLRPKILAQLTPRRVVYSTMSELGVYLLAAVRHRTNLMAGLLRISAERALEPAFEP